MPTARAALSPRSAVSNHTSDSSDYLLLTHDEHSPLLRSPSSSSSSAPAPASRPPLVALVQLAALLDLATTLALALRVPIRTLPPSAVALNLARGLVVVVAGAVSSGAHLAPVLLGQLVLSTLVLLYRLNELVQTTALPPSDAWINPTTVWYLASFAFAPLEYALFLVVVGVPRRRAAVGRRWAGGETRWDGAVVRVGAARSDRTSSVGGASLVDERAWAADELDSDGFASSSSSDDDADDIIDVPRPHPHLSSSVEPGLRNRTSRASLLSALSPPLAPGDDERPGFGASRGYGSIRSLAGI
ncbi:hypothetical protein JCM8208_001007 [Rhodotorula glutinis]